jgi:hypothetical protein
MKWCSGMFTKFRTCFLKNIFTSVLTCDRCKFISDASNFATMPQLCGNYASTTHHYICINYMWNMQPVRIKFLLINFWHRSGKFCVKICSHLWLGRDNCRSRMRILSVNFFLNVNVANICQICANFAEILQ